MHQFVPSYFVVLVLLALAGACDAADGPASARFDPHSTLPDTGILCRHPGGACPAGSACVVTSPPLPATPDGYDQGTCRLLPEPCPEPVAGFVCTTGYWPTAYGNECLARKAGVFEGVEPCDCVSPNGVEGCPCDRNDHGEYCVDAGKGLSCGCSKYETVNGHSECTSWSWQPFWDDPC